MEMEEVQGLLDAGTVIHINGLPFNLTQETVVMVYAHLDEMIALLETGKQKQEDWRTTATKEIFEALDDLTFSCFAGLGLQVPAIDVYNHAFAVCEKYREQGLKPNISWRYRP